MATIALFDDSEDLMLCVRILNAYGHSCHPFHSSKSLSDFILEECPDLVVIDPHLNDGEGLVVLESLKKCNPDLYVVLYTDRSLYGDACGYFIADGSLIKQQGHSELLAFVKERFKNCSVEDDVPFHECFF